MLASPQSAGSPEVLFVDLPFNTYELGREFKAAWRSKRSVAPHELHLGFRYMVAALRAAGHSADILFPRENGRGDSDLLREIVTRQPRILGFTSYEGSLREAFRFIRRARNRGVKSLICMGGHLATFSYADILREHGDLVDVIALGEGEQTIIDLVSVANDQRPIESVAGIAFVRDGRMIVTPPRPVLRDIDSLPFPILANVIDNPSTAPLFMITSRGCYAHCSFCRTSYFGERWRARDPVQVVDEIERSVARGLRTFEFVDDNFLGPGRAGRRRAVAIADEIKRRDLNIRFHISCRVNDVDAPTLRALQDVGLISISLGVESGVQRMLDTFKKDITPDQTRTALHMLRGLGLRVLAYMIFFDPYMTLDEVAANVRFVAELHRLGNVRFEEILFRRLIPVSGTPLFSAIQSDGLLRGNYVDGYRFVFRERRVGWLASLMEKIDLRFERALQTLNLYSVQRIYQIKEFLELLVIEDALRCLSDRRLRRADFFTKMDNSISSTLRTTLAIPSPTISDASVEVDPPVSEGGTIDAKAKPELRRGA